MAWAVQWSLWTPKLAGRPAQRDCEACFWCTWCCGSILEWSSVGSLAALSRCLSWCFYLLLFFRLLHACFCCLSTQRDFWCTAREFSQNCTISLLGRGSGGNMSLANFQIPSRMLVWLRIGRPSLMSKIFGDTAP